MPRKNIFELLQEKYDIDEEMGKIESLFFEKLFSFTNPLNFHQEILSIEDIIEKILFISSPPVFVRWKQRGSCLNCEEMRKKLGVPRTKSLDDKIITLEYILNIIRLFQKNVGIGPTSNFVCSPGYVLLLQNITLLLERLNYEEHYFEDEEKVILIPKNPAATAVAELSSEDTAFAILMYHHGSLKGKLEEKKDILRRIAKEYETLLDKGVDGFSDYFDKARAFLNNLDIRHNNRSGKNKNPLIESLSAEELEKWYDELYQLLLFCVLIKDNTTRKNNMAEFLKGLKKG